MDSDKLIETIIIGVFLLAIIGMVLGIALDLFAPLFGYETCHPPECRP